MDTRQAPSAPPTQALVLHDPRPFLAQAIDRCLELGTWDIADLEVFTVDVVNMAFRYLARAQQDIRDLDAIAASAEIVCMFVDDGLRTHSGNDLNRAAALLASDGQPLLDAFRASWGALQQLRQQAQTFHGELRDIRVGPSGRTVALHPIPPRFHEFGSDRGLEDYSDVELLAAWRKGRSVTTARERLRNGIVLAERQYALLKLLPFDEVTRRWNELLIADGTIGFGTEVVNGRAYDMGWSSALIRAVECGDVGLVVTVPELTHFIKTHIVERDDSISVSEEAIAAAMRVLAPSLSTALGRPVEADLREALDHAADHILGTHRPPGEDDEDGDGAGQDVRQHIRWSVNAVFLAVSTEQHERAVLSLVGPMGQEELVDRFEGTVISVTADERDAILRQMDVAKMPIEYLVRVLETSPKRARRILQRAKLGKRPIEEIEALALAIDVEGASGRVVAEAILASREDLSQLSSDAVFALLLALPPTPGVSRDLLHRARMTPERLLLVFREADDRHVREEWVRLAAASGEHLTYLIGDVREIARHARDVVAAFQAIAGALGTVWIPAGVTARCFLEVEQAARRAPRQQGSRARRQQGKAAAGQGGSRAAGQQRRRPLLDERGEPVLLDPDLQWLWAKLPEHQQEAVRKAFRKAGTPTRKRKSAKKRSKKPTRKRRKSRR